MFSLGEFKHIKRKITPSKLLPSEKASTQKVNNLLILGAHSFLFRVEPFQKDYGICRKANKKFEKLDPLYCGEKFTAYKQSTLVISNPKGLWNISRYPYLDISELQNWGKKIEQPHLTNIYLICSCIQMGDYFEKRRYRVNQYLVWTIWLLHVPDCEFADCSYILYYADFDCVEV